MFIEQVHVEEWEWHEGHALYRISFKQSTSPNTTVLYRRYSQFLAIHQVTNRLLNEDGIELRFPVNRRMSWNSWVPSAEFLDKRCRDLDYFLQQLMGSFGGKHRGFWNDPAVVEFFTQADSIDGKLVQLDGEADWEEWEYFFKRGLELNDLLAKCFTYSTKTPNAQAIKQDHTGKMFEEFREIVGKLHLQLQRSPNAKDIIQRWTRLEPLLDFRDKHNYTGMSGVSEGVRENLKSGPIAEDSGTKVIPNAQVPFSDGPLASTKARDSTTTLGSDNHPPLDKIRQQDRQLDVLSGSVSRLKSLGLDMESEIREQTEISKSIQKLAENTEIRTKATTSRIQKL